MDSIDFEFNVVYVRSKKITDTSYTLSIENSNLMQYTGLKDKNGKEIYEGDIVKTTHLGHESIGEVRYAEKWATFYFATTNPHGIGIAIDSVHSWYYDEDDIKAEVIGNIYDNPDLVKE